MKKGDPLAILGIVAIALAFWFFFFRKKAINLKAVKKINPPGSGGGKNA